MYKARLQFIQTCITQTNWALIAESTELRFNSVAESYYSYSFFLHIIDEGALN